jgi:hypothetical protein
MGERTRLLVAVAAAAMCALPLRAAGPDLETLLDLASEYQVAFIHAFENVVAEEIYVQEMTSPRRKRTIKSDFLFVKYPDVAGVMTLRDPFEVDGRAVRDAASADRMMKLFTSPAGDAIKRARALAMEGARHNLLDIGTVNNPLLTMAFLQANYRPRFRFNLAGIEKDLGPTVRTVRFQEFRIPSILRTGANQDVLTSGLIWVDEQTGRVARTRLQIGPARTPPEVVTTFSRDEGLGIDVPSTMTDWYPDGTRGEIRGTATYSRFRRFGVKTEESIK